VFTGCSYTEGTGFEQVKEEPILWVNQLYNKYFSHTTKLNLGVGGGSNQRTFQNTVKALSSMPVEYAIVQWTSMPRYEIQLGFELYSTRAAFIPNSTLPDWNVHGAKYNSRYLNEIKDRFTSLAHACWEIIDVVSYTNIILNIAKFTNTKVFFVNGLCPWDQDFFNKKQNVLPNQYTPYTQEILEVETRDDENVFALYDKLHSHFESDGGINQNNWLNLYQSMRRNRVDVNPDNVHPGIESNHFYTDMFSKILDQQLQDL
jgi:hypothetical protein